MTRDYKNTTPREKPASKGSPFFSGLLVGLLLGVGLSVVMAIFITGVKSPFEEKVTPAPVIEAEKSEEVPAAEPAASADEAEKPRFDFYTILPGTEQQVTEEEITRQEVVAARESYYLQVGAFQTEQEADNMKANLALQGLEAIVQTAEIPGKGVLHRVRIGPFSDLEEISKSRALLEQNGFASDLIKVNSNTPNQ
jgi:cell division protein FtsN